MTTKIILPILTIFILCNLTSCYGGKGRCNCENPDASIVYTKRPGQTFQKFKNEANQKCQDRATTYSTTCTLEIPK
jgi:hypothetical protein